MSYKKALDELKYDVRMRAYNLSEGILKQEEVNSFESSLQDSANNMEYITLEDDDSYDADGNYI